MECADCGAAVTVGDRFCATCGAALRPTCAACGEPLAPGGRFCPACGEPVSTAASPDGPARPTAERRVTSVLFGDLVGFTTLSEAHDPEDVRELLSGYFQECRAVVDRYDGTIEKFVGDAVMAVWGVPVAHEDDAERAVRAGAELVDAVRVYGERTGMAGLALRVGVVTGEVAVTVGAVGEGMVAGDAVNTAARVQSCARPGSVWTDAETRSLTSAAVDYVATGAHALKGKAHPLALFEVVAVRGGDAGPRPADPGETPLVGRHRELAAVTAAFDAVVDSGRAGLLVVTGPPGVGKTRLGVELSRHLQELPTTVRWHWGRALAYGDRIAFAPLAAALRGRVGVVDGDGPDTVAARIAASLGEYTDDAPTVARLVPRLAVLLSGTADIPFSREDLTAAWREWFELLGSNRTPVVWVVDDAQHADDGVLDFVERLLASAGGLLLIVLLARPELLERRPGLTTTPRASVVDLAGLPGEAVRDLVGRLVTGLPAAAVAALAERAEGLPLYAVELVRALVDRGLVVEATDGSRTAVDTADLDLLARTAAPTSLRVLISSRLDALPGPQRALLGAAAVLGSSFTATPLAVLTATPVERVTRQLAALVQRDLVQVVVDPLSAEVGRHTFVQTSVRQVAYETLSRRDRVERHLSAVTYLQRQPESGGTLAGVVAGHLAAAGDLLPATDPRQPDIRAQASRWHERAGDRALSLGAPGEAVASFLLAVDRATAPDDVARLHLSVASAAITAGRYDIAVEHAQAVDRTAPVALMARAVAAHGQALRRDGRSAEACEVLQPWADRLEEVPAPEASDLLRELAFVLHSRGDLDAAVPVGVRALELARTVGDPSLVVRALNVVAIHDDLRGRWRDSRDLYTQAAALAREHGLILELGFVLQNLSNLEVIREPPASVPTARAALDLAQRTGHVNQAIYAATNLIEALRAVGRWDDAIAVAREPVIGDSIAAGQLDMRQVALDLGLIALARGVPPPDVRVRTSRPGGRDPVVEAVQVAARGDLGVAFDLARGALLARHAATELWEEFGVLWTATVDWGLAAGRFDGAGALLALVADAPPDAVTPILAAQLLRLRGTLAARSSSSGGAVEADLRAAVDALDRLGVAPSRARAQAELGTWLAARGRTADAAALLAAARAQFSALGAVAWSADLDRGLASYADRG